MAVFNKLKEFILNIFLPKRCIFCGKMLDYNAYLSICKKCVVPALAKEKPKRDFDQKYFDSCLCATYYENYTRRAMIKFKFKGITNLSNTFAHMMIIKIKEDWRFVTSDFIISVPLSKKRLKQRGYNQSHLLAKKVANELKIPYIENLLIKTKDIPRLSKLSLAERRKIVKGVYKFNNNFDIKDKSIVLIDDIFTTGSTVNECARILKKNGARNVFVITACETRKNFYGTNYLTKNDFFVNNIK